MHRRCHLGPSRTSEGQAPSGCEVWALSPACCRPLWTEGAGPRAESTGAHRLQQTDAGPGRRTDALQPQVFAGGRCGPVSSSGVASALLGRSWGDRPPPGVGRQPWRQDPRQPPSAAPRQRGDLLGRVQVPVPGNGFPWPFWGRRDGLRICGRVAAPGSCIWGKGSTPREQGMLSPSLGFRDGSEGCVQPPCSPLHARVSVSARSHAGPSSGEGTSGSLPRAPGGWWP